MTYRRLPREMKLEIFSFLEPNELYHIALVSKESSELVKNDFIWKYKRIKYESDKKTYCEKYKYSCDLEKLEKWLRQYMEFDDLLSITIINLNMKNLKEIPVELGLLSNLRELYLSNNQLKEIPKELGNLRHLRRLSLLNNQLEEIPDEIGNIYFDNINLKNNPIKVNKLPSRLFNFLNSKFNRGRISI